MEILHTEVRKLLSGGLRRDVQREKTQRFYASRYNIYHFKERSDFQTW